MKLTASCGNLPRAVDLRDRCQILKMKAQHPDPEYRLLEEELLARLNIEIGGEKSFMPLLSKLRKMQGAPEDP